MRALPFIFGTVAFAVAVCSNSVAQPDRNAVAAAIVERTGCLGSCPSYEAEIHADGHVVWNGRVTWDAREIAVKGKAEGQVDAAAIAVVFKKYFPDAEREVCIEERGIDSPVYYVLFSRTGNLAELRSERDDYYRQRQSDPTIAEPCKLGEKFDAAITELERVANTHRWLHGDESLQESEKVSADVFYGTKPGFTAMLQAAGEGKREELAATINTTPVDSADESGWTALMVAVSRCRSEIVSLLLSKGANPNARDRHGDSSLIAAATAYCDRFDPDEQPKARYDLIKQLVAGGAKVDAANGAGQTPLMVAARFGNDDAIKALLAVGANLRAKDKAGMDAKAYATKYEQDVSKHNSDYQREYRVRFRNALRLLANAEQNRVPR